MYYRILMKISVILPIYNEATGIEEMIRSIAKTKIPGVTDLEIVAVDDGSYDSTPQILNRLSHAYKNMRVVTHSLNRGYGATLKSGAHAATYDWILFMDADMQFHIKSLKPFLQYTTDFDYVVGYRKDRADNTRRKIVSFIYNRIVRLMFDLSIRDVDCAFKLMKRNTVRRIKGLPNSFFVSAALMIKSLQQGVIIKELPVKHLPRTKGVSTVTISQVLRTIRDLALLYQKTVLAGYVRTLQKLGISTQDVAKHYVMQTAVFILTVLYAQHRGK